MDFTAWMIRRLDASEAYSASTVEVVMTVVYGIAGIVIHMSPFPYGFCSPDETNEKDNQVEDGEH